CADREPKRPTRLIADLDAIRNDGAEVLEAHRGPNILLQLPVDGVDFILPIRERRACNPDGNSNGERASMRLGEGGAAQNEGSEKGKHRGLFHLILGALESGDFGRSRPLWEAASAG